MPREIHIWNVRLVEVAWENLEGRKRCRFDVGLSLGGLSSLGGLERSDSQLAIHHRHPAGVTNVIDGRTDGHSRRNRDFGTGRLRLPSIPDRVRPDFYLAAEEKHVLPSATAAAAS